MKLADKVLELQKREAYLQALYDNAEKEIKALEKVSKQETLNAELYNACAKALTDTSLIVQNSVTHKIEKIVTSIYRYVFGGTDEFVIKVDTKRKVPVASFWIQTQKNGKTVLLDPMSSEGGGKVDVIALGLRIAGLLLLAPSKRKVLFLDEPLRFLSSSLTSAHPYRLRAVDFLKQVSKAYGIQVIAVTHDSELKELADSVINVSLDENGFSVLTKEN